MSLIWQCWSLWEQGLVAPQTALGWDHLFWQGVASRLRGLPLWEVGVEGIAPTLTGSLNDAWSSPSTAQVPPPVGQGPSA